MKARNHARSAAKKNFSIALPTVLIEKLQQIADAEMRSKNRQIELFLDREVKNWIKANQRINPPLTAVPDKKGPADQKQA